MATNPCDEVQILYKGDGLDTLFTFPFPYHVPGDIRVALWNNVTQDYTDLVYQTDWEFDNATTVKLTVAPPAPPTQLHATDPDVYNVKVYRTTDIDPLDATFNPGSAIRAEDLNNNFEQLRLAIEEGRCFVPPSIKKYLQYNYWNTIPGNQSLGKDSNGKKITGDTITEPNQLSERWVDSDLNTDDKIATAKAISRRLDAYVQDPMPAPVVAPDKTQPGKTWIDTDHLTTHYWDPNGTSDGAWVELANTGPRGPDGIPATVDAGSLTVTDPNIPATVVNSGTTNNAIFDFFLPDQGDAHTGVLPIRIVETGNHPKSFQYSFDIPSLPTLN